MINYSIRNKLLELNFKNSFCQLTKSIDIENQSSFNIDEYSSKEDSPKIDKIYKQTNAIIKENGINTCHLINGLLKWKPFIKLGRENLYHTPVFIMPLELRKERNIEDNFTANCLEDNWIVNPILAHVLKEQFGLKFDSQSTSEVFEQLKKNWELDENLFGIDSFSFKSMSIYTDLGNISSLSASLESMLKSSPKPLLEIEHRVSPLDFKLILPADYTQLQSMKWVKDGENILIQGPPGTGKSQTIVNIIAQALIQNKNVLFVSEKRVALDVVYQKLVANGLKHFTALIHDVKLDKQHFIEELNSIYTNFYQKIIQDKPLEQKNIFRDHLNSKMQLLDNYFQISEAVDPLVGLSFNDLKGQVDKISNEKPVDILLSDWKRTKNIFSSVLQKVESKTGKSKINQTALLFIKLKKEGSYLFEEKVLEILKATKSLANNTEHLSVQKLYFLSVKASLFKIFINSNATAIFNPNKKLHQQFWKLKNNIEAEKIKALKYQRDQGNWNCILTSEEWKSLADIIQANELNHILEQDIRYQNAKKFIEENFNWGAYKTKPTLKRIVERKVKLIEAEEKIKSIEEEISILLKVDHIHDFEFQLNYILSKIEQKDDEFLFLVECLKSEKDISFLIEIHEYLKDVYHSLESKFRRLNNISIEELINHYELCIRDRKIIEEVAFELNELSFLNEDQWETLSDLSLADLEHFELKVKQVSIVYLKNKYPLLATIDDLRLLSIVDEVKELLKINYNENSSEIYNSLKHQFQLKNRTLSNPNSKLNSETKEEKRKYNIGRKILEKEFAKKRRFSALRTLMTLESNVVIHDIKKVWLTSPSVVSELFPLESEIFDLVVFDESSMIDFAHSIPSFFRAKQVVVVGDEMQMPPSKYFQTKQSSEEEDQFESLLQKAIEQLPSVLLKHHYRSNYRDLIQFSNEYFYNGQLKILSDKTGGLNFHLVENGIYSENRNIREAEYAIALLKKLTITNPRLSIGIATFSIEQKKCIEKQMEIACKQDIDLKHSIARLENMEEYFFVKNLENIQGDERDIIIISMGYGYNEEGDFRQHFGPLNHEGGERRLNVLISRAKEQMHWISSIHQSDITNEDNDGANALKLFLNFAEYGILKGFNESETQRGKEIGNFYSNYF